MSTAEAETFRVDRERPKRYSMSFLRAADGCMRRASMERDVDTGGPDALVGRLVHEVTATVGFRCVMAGQVTTTADEVLAIAERVMHKPEDPNPLPLKAWDEVMRMLKWWAPRAEFGPGEMFEVGFRVPHAVTGRIISGRIDRLWHDGDTEHVRDYKTGWGDPADGLSVQGRIYAWARFRENPDLQRVIYAEEHLRHNLLSGPWEITRDQAANTDRWLAAAVARIDAAYDKQVFEAKPGVACSSPSRCPVAASCPVPEWARESTVIETEAEALAAFEELLVRDARRGALTAAIRGWVEQDGRRALVHNGKEIGFGKKNGTRFDKKRMAADLQAAKGDGAEVNVADYTAETAPSFGQRNA